MTATIIREESFEPADYRGELDAAPSNLDVGTRLWFENDRIRVWECGCSPASGARSTPHTCRYFWTVVDGGTGRQRTADGTMITREYHVGDTNYSEHSPSEPMIHDFENVGDAPIRFVTVELLD